MKKIFVKAFLLLSVLSLLVSCKLEKAPEAQAEQAAWNSITDANLLRQGLYAMLRSNESPGNLMMADLQSALFNIEADDNNAYSAYYNWYELSLSTDSNIESYYAGFYNLIMQTCYFEMRANEAINNKAQLIADGKFVEDDFATIQHYIAEAKVMRALAYYRLMCRFSYRYEDGSRLALPLLTTYELNTQREQSTQKQVYDYALQILDEAIAVLPATYEGATIDNIPSEIPQAYAYALKARIQLEMHNYQGVIESINSFISDYPLDDISGLADDEKKAAVEAIYVTEDSKEIMCKLYSSTKIGRSSSPYTGGITQAGEVYFIPSFIPSQYVLDVYNMDGGTPFEDVRASVYLQTQTQAYWGVKVQMMHKFIGNPELNTTNLPDFAVSTHLFNVAEAYLMLAEAQAFSNNISGTLDALNQLRRARGLATDITAAEIATPKDAQELVKRERIRELIGEGTNMNDLKRWGDPMDRKNHGQPQIIDENNPLALGEVLKMGHADQIIPYNPDDALGKMFAWEFPKNDLVTNKNLKPNWKR